MKSLLKSLIPEAILEIYRRRKRSSAQARNRDRSAEEVFTEIYEQNKWGGSGGEFCSGDGTTDSQVVSAYVEMVAGAAAREGFKGQRFVDLGCGDFRVGRQLLSLCGSYTGVDVVKPLVAGHQEQFGNETTRFVHLDIANDELPDGDVCFVRQVFQHLSNAQIGQVLQKLKKYRWVFITEHYPTNNPRIEPNVDKVHGGDVRVYYNSGVYLAEPPFKLPEDSLREVLEVPGVGVGDGSDPGVIRTVLYEPGK